MSAVEQSKAPGLAATSLICGLFGFLTCFLTGIPAIITGHMAQSKIKQSHGTLGGLGMALTGTILGYVTTAAAIFILPLTALITPAIFKAVERANQVTNINNARAIHSGLAMYAIDHSNNFPPDLASINSPGNRRISPLVFEYMQGQVTTNWTYYPGSKSTDDSNTIVLSGPVSKDGKTRILLTIGGHVTVEDEVDAQSLAKAQGITLP